ncbi:MAG: hypothetical protein BWX79_03363 [Alphaproteobacteria bacterium ADurb.Bin100]|nr:MAG: hypothetical protein BWX79_03363 [Alphaproteobacteria bacterium ADurb.Bin100]
MSGQRRTISDGSAMMRFLPSGSLASSAKQSSPPAMPTSSDTQRMALIGGSSHSSKYTRGRRGSREAAASIACRPARIASIRCRPCFTCPTIAATW